MAYCIFEDDEEITERKQKKKKKKKKKQREREKNDDDDDGDKEEDENSLERMEKKSNLSDMEVGDVHILFI